MKRYFKHIICLAFISVMAIGAVAAPRKSTSGISVSATVDSAVIVMGDLTHVRVAVDMPAEAAAGARMVDFPQLSPGEEYQTWNGIDVVAVDTVSSIVNGQRRINYDITVQAFDPGTVSLPPFAVLGSEGADTTFSNVVTFKVLSVELDSIDAIHPIASVVEPATKWYDYIPSWLIWVLVGLAVIAAAVVAYFLLRKQKIEAEIERAKPVPPYDLALSRLNTLRSRNLAESGQEKEYYTELVDILRQYLEGRFDINAMEKTSSQIVKALRANPKTKMTADQVRSVLSIADFVKFAKVRPLPDDNVRAFSRALDFVEQTKPEPDPEPEENKESETINQKR